MIIYKKALALNNLQLLIWHETKPNETPVTREKLQGVSIYMGPMWLLIPLLIIMLCSFLFKV